MISGLRWRWYGWLVLGSMFMGCTDQERVYEPDRGTVEAGSDLLVRILPEDHVDSAQVFFFRKMGNTDTLISRQIIHDIAFFQPRLFQFELPAGEYVMAIYGNVATNYIVANPPYSQSDIYFDYNGGGRPSEIYYGRTEVNAGVDTANIAGMIALSSFVQLTIRKVPETVSRIVVRLLNTAAGFTITSGYLPVQMDPPLADTLYDLQGDSSYVASFYCFPGFGTDNRSTLEVSCYDGGDQLVYFGKSEPFQARYGYSHTVNCSFAGSALRKRSIAHSVGKLYFETGVL